MRRRGFRNRGHPSNGNGTRPGQSPWQWPRMLLFLHRRVVGVDDRSTGDPCHRRLLNALIGREIGIIWRTSIWDPVGRRSLFLARGRLVKSSSVNVRCPLGYLLSRRSLAALSLARARLCRLLAIQRIKQKPPTESDAIPPMIKAMITCQDIAIVDATRSLEMKSERGGRYGVMRVIKPSKGSALDTRRLYARLRSIAIQPPILSVVHGACWCLRWASWSQCA